MRRLIRALRSAAQARHGRKKTRGRVLFEFMGAEAYVGGAGAAAYAGHAAFREAFDRIAADLRQAGWAHDAAALLVDLSGTPPMEVRCVMSVTLQLALVDALRERAAPPDAVLGFCVGFLPAAYAAGALTRAEAARAIAEMGGMHRQLLNGMDAEAPVQVALPVPLADALRLIEGTAGTGLVAALRENFTVVYASGRGYEVLSERLRQRGLRPLMTYRDPAHTPMYDAVQHDVMSGVPDEARAVTVPLYVSYQTEPLREVTPENWWRAARDAVCYPQTRARCAEAGFETVAQFAARPARGWPASGPHQKPDVVPVLGTGQKELSALVTAGRRLA